MSRQLYWQPRSTREGHVVGVSIGLHFVDQKSHFNARQDDSSIPRPAMSHWSELASVVGTLL